ncbi:MAG: hypothetical protein U1C49_00955 [Candidatus Andersenbacteria bacterium]|nr:hypothetical protein [bacterium]MDZ4225395.1 hypothetical protein [Candidatus Andersenbacteria bacterium]
MEFQIETTSEDPWEFEVTLLEEDTVLGEYTVTMTAQEYDKYASDMEPEEIVKATLKFLLDREDPEMIMDRFRLKDVENYFPDYPRAVGDYF